jgi:signal transduction histidine kinase
MQCDCRNVANPCESEGYFRSMVENELRLVQPDDQLQQLSRRLLSVQEEERRALSRELHDDFGQQLVALKLNLSTLEGILRNQAPHPAPRSGQNLTTAGQRCTADCLEITDHIIERVREIARNLRPSILDDLGLSAALHGYTQHQAKRSGCTIEVRACILPLKPEIEIAVFRIVQEAVSNAIRHGAASHITVVAQCDESVLRLVIQDNGCGFDPEERSVRPEPGMGLITMRERTHLLGGRLTHTGQPGAGTRIEVTIPLEGMRQ